MTRSDCQQQLAAVEAYMASSAYVAYLDEVDERIKGIEATILSCAPVTAELAATMCVEFGKREVAYRQQIAFEEQRDLLKRLIASCDENGNVVVTT